ncbi:MAG: hypothetical protein CMH98_01190 [Oceanospirillaceae bacterium]|nr:hypothetical protein [Oceanospirillaceae bacterium]
MKPFKISREDSLGSDRLEPALGSCLSFEMVSKKGGGKWSISFTLACAQERPVTEHFFMWFSKPWTIDEMESESLVYGCVEIELLRSYP